MNGDNVKYLSGVKTFLRHARHKTVSWYPLVALSDNYPCPFDMESSSQGPGRI